MISWLTAMSILTTATGEEYRTRPVSAAELFRDREGEDEAPCSRARSDMTPCVLLGITGASYAWTSGGKCVGCGRDAAQIRADGEVPSVPDPECGVGPRGGGGAGLLPCPFCGTAERDDEQERGLENWLQVTDSGGMYRVECFGCGVEARLFDLPEEAIAAWNRRHPGDQDQGETK